MPRPDVSTLSCFFEPRSVAVIGASRTPGRAGHTLVENLKSSFPGAVYPINAQADAIAGLKSFATVCDVPGEVDLAVVLVPARSVPAAIDDCAAKGVRGAVVEASDFAEVGPEGKALQDRIAAVARRANMRLWGPNCLGVIDTRSGLVTTYQPLRDVRPGNVSLVTQSGAIAGAVLLQVHESRIFSFNKVCSIGNKADVDESDLLEYLAGDHGTRVIAMYLESINDGRRFVDLVRGISREKPVIVMKSGRTALGVSASLGHTASLAGDDRVVSAALAEAGAIRVDDIGEFLTVVKAFDRLSALPMGRRVAIVCTTGAGGVMAADQIGLHGLDLARLSPTTMRRLHQQFPPSLAPDQPLDVSLTMMKVGPNRALQSAMAAVLEDEGVDAVMLQTFGLPVTSAFDPDAMAELVRSHRKPVVVWLYGTRQFLDPWTRALDDRGLPVMPDLRSAARAFQTLAEWNENRARLKAQATIVPASACGRRAGMARAPFERTPSMREAFALLGCYGIPVVRGDEAASPAEAAALAGRLGFPVAVKTANPAIAHKSDVGGVRLGLGTADEVARAAAQLAPLAAAGEAPVFVQEMAAPGLEFIVGARRDPQFGPVVVCGLGGLWVEVLKDVAVGLAPVGRAQAERMLDGLKAHPLLAGARGRKPRDADALCRVIEALGQIMIDHPEIDGIEINPFILLEAGQGGTAVDVLVEVAAPAPPALEGRAVEVANVG